MSSSKITILSHCHSLQHKETMFKIVDFTWPMALTLALMTSVSAIPAPGYRSGHIRDIVHGNEDARNAITVYDSWDW